MSRSFKTQAARLRHDGQKSIKVKAIDPGVAAQLQTLDFGRNAAARYGQQRQMRAKMKVDARRARRAKERTDTHNDIKDL